MLMLIVERDQSSDFTHEGKIYIKICNDADCVRSTVRLWLCLLISVHLWLVSSVPPGSSPSFTKLNLPCTLSPNP